jgi:hypothetical protein
LGPIPNPQSPIPSFLLFLVLHYFNFDKLII